MQIKNIYIKIVITTPSDDIISFGFKKSVVEKQWIKKRVFKYKNSQLIRDINNMTFIICWMSKKKQNYPKNNVLIKWESRIFISFSIFYWIAEKKE